MNATAACARKIESIKAIQHTTPAEITLHPIDFADIMAEALRKQTDKVSYDQTFGCYRFMGIPVKIHPAQTKLRRE